METYRRLETPKLWAIFKTQTISDDGILSDSTLTDPSTSIQIIIEDATGAVVQSLAAMTKSETGKYYYDGYAIPATAKTGIWHYEVRGTHGTKVAVGHSTFRVKEQVA